MTSRAFRDDIKVPREHIERVLEAARHSPSGANAQPWHYVVVIDPGVKIEETRKRAKLKMNPTPNDHGLEMARGSHDETYAHPIGAS